MKTERQVVAEVIARAHHAGYTIQIRGEFHTYETAVGAVFDCDETRARFYKNGSYIGAILFVINGGTGEAAEEVVCDYSDNEAMRTIVGDEALDQGTRNRL